MSIVRVPAVMAQVANLPGTQLEAQGHTLRETMEDLCDRYEPLRAHLFYENSTLKEHFLFTNRGELLAPEDPILGGSEIDVMLATSGGMDVNDQLTNEEVRRYVRHITLPDVGRQGQLRLKHAKVLIIGTGGLGSPASLYLAAAGVGTLGLIDFDVVETSNLQRQVVHGNSTVGLPKVVSAERRLSDLNPDISIQTHNTALNADNALPLIAQYDLVVDGTDNFSTRYIVNDACVQLHKPLVYGAVYRFDGQVSVFNHAGGPCYRCLFPSSPPSELSPSCSAGGVIGVLPGVVGTLQATETVKILLGLGDPLVGRLLCFDALAMQFKEVRFKRRADCPSCAPSRSAELPPAPVCAMEPSGRPAFSEGFYIEPRALKDVLDSGTNRCVLLDVREANELEVCKLPDAKNVPLNQLKDRLGEFDKSQAHFLICYGGVRAERAVKTMLEAGFSNARILKGGMKRWVKDVDPDMPIY